MLLVLRITNHMFTCCIFQLTPLSPAVDLPLYEDLSPYSVASSPASQHDLSVYEDLTPCDASTPAPATPAPSVCYEAQPSPAMCYEAPSPSVSFTSSCSSGSTADPDHPLNKLSSALTAYYKIQSPASCNQAPEIQGPCSPAVSYTSCGSPAAQTEGSLQKLTSALASCHEAPGSPEEREQLLQDLDDICATDAPHHKVG